MDGQKPYKRLSDIPKKEFFKAPEGYFDSLQAKIDKNISEKNEAKVISITSWKYIGLAAAATISLIIIFGPGIVSDQKEILSTEELLANIPEEDCLAYLKNTEVEIEDLLALPDPELWNEAMKDAVAAPEMNENDADYLYEQYGVSPDETLEIL